MRHQHGVRLRGRLGHGVDGAPTSGLRVGWRPDGSGPGESDSRLARRVFWIQPSRRGGSARCRAADARRARRSRGACGCGAAIRAPTPTMPARGSAAAGATIQPCEPSSGTVGAKLRSVKLAVFMSGPLVSWYRGCIATPPRCACRFALARARISFETRRPGALQGCCSASARLRAMSRATSGLASTSSTPASRARVRQRRRHVAAHQHDRDVGRGSRGSRAPARSRSCRASPRRTARRRSGRASARNASSAAVLEVKPTGS